MPEQSRAVPVLLLAVLAISWAAPLVRLTDAPPLVIAAWRLVIATIVLLPFFLAGTPRREWAALTARDRWIAALAGAVLALHFGAWITAVRLTTVAASGVLVALSPVFAWGLSRAFLDDRPTGRQIAGIAIAIAGAVLVASADARHGSRQALLGDALALFGALCAGIYFVAGRRLRASLSLVAYITPVYAACAVLLLIGALLRGDALWPRPPGDWAVFSLLALGPMLLGHTGFNYALRFVPAYVVGVAALAEPVGATLLAWALPAIREPPGPITVAGGLVCLAGVALTLTGNGAPRRTPG